MSTQNRTLDRYQELMQINAASHVLRTARQVGLFDQLRGGQKTADQLADALQLSRPGLDLLLECLITLNVIERYQDDHALAPVMQLLCQYDHDLGDAGWQRLTAVVQSGERTVGEPVGSDRTYLDSLAATQWIHTPAAMQAAEMLDMGGPTGPTGTACDDGSFAPLRILDLGCGSAVWSCAMAYRDGRATLVVVDDAAPLAAATSTANAIDLNERFKTLAGNPETIDLSGEQFGLAIIAQRLHATDETGRQALIDKAYQALVPGGRLVVIDLFRGPAKPSLSETVEALRIHTATGGTGQGRMLAIEELQQQLKSRGMNDIRFTFIEASRLNFGMMVATKSR